MREEEIVQLYREAFDRGAQRYEENFVPLFRPLAKRLIELAAIREGERVLDIGTGTGLAALLAAPLVGKSGYVLGVDVSEGMLAIAKKKAPKEHFPHIDFQQMDARALDLPSSSFNLVLSSFGMPFTHPQPATKEAHRVLAPGGRLVFQEWGSAQEGDDEAAEAFQQVLSQFRVKRLSGWGAQFRKAREASTQIWDSFEDPQDIERVVKESGFARVEVFEEHHPTFLPNAEAYWNLQLAKSGARTEFEAMAEEKQTAFKEEALKALSRLTSKKGVLLPWVVIRVRGFKG